MSTYRPPRGSLFSQPGDELDASESQRRKDAGMEQAASALQRAELLELARNIAKTIAGSREDRTCTADDVARVMTGKPYDCAPGCLGPAAGSIFRGKEWEFTGRRVRSIQTANHARELKVWRLTNENE